MDVIFFMKIWIDTQTALPGTGIAESCLRGFLHDVTELAGQSQFAFSRHDRRFDRQRVPSDFRPGEPGRRTDLVFLFRQPIAVLGRSQRSVSAIFLVRTSSLSSDSITFFWRLCGIALLAAVQGHGHLLLEYIRE